MILPYIINVALVLGACLAFYKILLRRETFYKVNRYMLMVCLVIAFALPLFTVPEQFSLRKASGKEEVASGEGLAIDNKQLAIDNAQQAIRNQHLSIDNKQSATTQLPTSNLQPPTPIIEHPTSFFENYATPVVSTTPSNTENVFSLSQFLNWMFWIYWFGVILFGATFLFQLILLLYRSFRNPVIIDGKYRIVEMTGDKAPCSFGNTIFINPSKYDWETYNQILLHEKVHVSQKHTFDILFAELVLIFQWFNPFAWIYRKEVESNLEFLTDDQVVQQKEIDKRSYQLSLLKVTAPNFPLSLTTNYNQSILKKRIAMMNTKRSNLHTAWKYFFLLPVLAFLACMLNEPKANSQTSNVKRQTSNVKSETNDTRQKSGMENEGYWFAIIKDDKVNIRFSDEKMDKDFDEDDFKGGHSFSGSTYKLSELGELPKGTTGTFSILREAGKMELTGKFEGNTGMGTYKFIADKAYVDFMSKELGEKLDEEDQLAFFFINIKKDYLQTLKNEGFTKITKDDIIPMAAMNIDAAYIRSIKNAGFKDVSMEDLIPLKALGVDGNYIKEIRDAGYKNVTTDQLVTFKSQGIDKEYIGKMRQLKGKDDKEGDDDDEDDADDMVSFKAMGIDEAFINSFKAMGLNIPNDQLVSFKALGITPEYIKGWHNAGFKNIDPEEFVGMKSQDVTPEYMKSFTDMGFKNIKPEDLVGFKAMGVTPEYIKGWQNAGFKDIDFDEFVGMKSQNVTPEFMKSFTDLGYKNVKPEDLVAFRALGITAEYIKSWHNAGYKDIDFDELPALKSQNITPEYLKSFEEVGFRNIDIEDAVSAKVMGVTPAYIKEMRSKGFNYDKLEKYIRLKSID